MRTCYSGYGTSPEVQIRSGLLVWFAGCICDVSRGPECFASSYSCMTARAWPARVISRRGR